MHPVRSPRIVRTYTQHIDAPPERVFPLLCPVRESEWLDGWAEEVEMIHSDSGVAEEGCVFRTRLPGRPETIWIVSRHDPAACRVEFCRVTSGWVATRLVIQVAAAPAATSSVAITYTLTPLGADGVAFLAESFGEAAFRDDMAFWERSMNYWLATGEILRTGAARTVALHDPVPRLD
jgi:hypothetical protein